MKVFVTGGAGFMGANFIQYWLDKYPNDKIINYDKLTYSSNLEKIEEFKSYKNYTFIQGDIVDYEKLYLSTEGIDIMVHFAAESHVDRSIQNDLEFINSNVLGTRNVLLAAKTRKVKRFHHVSTDEVFGSLPMNGHSLFSDHSKYDPRSPYAASKAAADHWVRTYYHTFGVPITITNSSNNFGPYQFPEKFIPLMITNFLENKPMPIYGNGENIRDWLFVNDHTTAVEAALLKGEVGETYYVSTNNQWPNITVAKKVLEIMDKPESLLKFVKDRPGHDQRYGLSNEKLLGIGWLPTGDFNRNLKETIEWYIFKKDWWTKIKESDTFKEYYNKQYGGLV